QGDLPRILQEAERSHSVISRFRCLLGAARLLGCEPAMYRLALADEAGRDRMAAEALRDQPEALREFMDGNWRAALRRLVDRDARLAPLADCGFEEVFLLALATLFREG
ncbi:MAG: hypothetical protein LDL55_06450, partial [Armatimonadetes bacterium]|nr:hypothetical protein [Armatimonadota bacterium]